MVLIIVLVVIVALSLGALAFSSLMISEREVARMTGRHIQATALAESAIEAARQFLFEQPDVRFADGTWHDDVELFRGILVIDDEIPRDRGRFSIVAPGQGESPGSVRFGLECESSKLNLNTLLAAGAADARSRLMALPDMTEEIADCILDWLDTDDEPRQFGAEAEYYESLDPPYKPANGPIRCLEELLFVRGVTSWHLYGADRNRNGVIDADESELPMLADVDTTSGSIHCGWVAYMTVCSREQNCQPDGQPKIDLNQQSAEDLYDELEAAFGSEWATFIVGYRQQEQLYTETNTASPPTGGSAPTNPMGGAAAVPGSSGTVEVEYADHASGELDLEQPLKQKLGSVLDLIGAKIKVKYKESQKLVVVSPLFPKNTESMRDYLPKLMGRTSTSTEKTLSGRINVNLAPAAVLASVPGVDTTLAEEIVRRRPTDPLSVADHQHDPTWLLVDGLVSLDQMKKLQPYLTAGGSVYRVQAVGFFDEGGPIVRLQAVLDATDAPPRMLSLKSLTPLGRGFDPAELGAEP